MKNEIELPEGWQERQRPGRAGQLPHAEYVMRRTLRGTSYAVGHVFTFGPDKPWRARIKNTDLRPGHGLWIDVGAGFPDPVTAMVACMIEVSNG